MSDGLRDNNNIDEQQKEDIAALAKGGKTNVLGFILRLAARVPFLFIIGWLYAKEDVGRFAYAILVVEFVAQLSAIGLRRGLAEQLSNDDRPHANIVADGLLLGLLASSIGVSILVAFPQIMFHNSQVNGMDRFFPLIIFVLVSTEISLAALAYRFDIASAVRARAVVEPWALAISAIILYSIIPRDGLIISYLVAMSSALIAALIPLYRSYGLPKEWRMNILGIWQTARRNVPLAMTDAIEWGSRRMDLAILGLFVSPSIAGVYYILQQIASLPQKLKTSFDPILGPVITRSIREKRYADIGKQVGQVGFWIIAAQTALALGFGITGKSVLPVVGGDDLENGILISGFVGALIFLLIAEVVASTAVVSEAALIYMARKRNLMISLSMLGLQAALSFTFIYAVDYLNIAAQDRPLYYAASVSLALALSLGLSSFVKLRFLQKLLDMKITIFRMALFWAIAAAIIVGQFVTQTPAWFELSFGEVMILGVYAFVIWTRGFGPEDRVLFQKNKKKMAAKGETK